MDAVIDHQFETAEQQHEAMRLGMWIFLTSEILLFGGAFMLYAIYRSAYAAGFAEASSHLYPSIGILNTAVLLISSLTMALAVQSAKLARRHLTFWLLLATAMLGAIFFGLKIFEYALDYQESIIPILKFDATLFERPDEARLFFTLYFAMTGLHALHLLIGILVVMTAAAALRFDALKLGETTVLEPIGLYWHLVDVIWVFLMPLLYLIAQ